MIYRRSVKCYLLHVSETRTLETLSQLIGLLCKTNTNIYYTIMLKLIILALLLDNSGEHYHNYKSAYNQSLCILLFETYLFQSFTCHYQMSFILLSISSFKLGNNGFIIEYVIDCNFGLCFSVECVNVPKPVKLAVTWPVTSRRLEHRKFEQPGKLEIILRALLFLLDVLYSSTPYS